MKNLLIQLTWDVCTCLTYPENILLIVICWEFLHPFNWGVEQLLFKGYQTLVEFVILY